MSLWGSIDQANNAPKNAIAGGLGVAVNGETLFGNTQVSAFVTNTGIGDFGVSAVEAGVAGNGKKVQHAGWNLRKVGTGPIINLQVTDPGANYRSDGFITFSGNGGANAAFTVNTTTNTISSITIVNGGRFTVTPSANAANSTSVNSATILVTMGGRANRVHMETLVAMGSMTGDAEDAIFPNS